MARDGSALACSRVSIDVVFLAMALKIAPDRDELTNKLATLHTFTVICFARMPRRFSGVCSSSMSR